MQSRQYEGPVPHPDILSRGDSCGLWRWLDATKIYVWVYRQCLKLPRESVIRRRGTAMLFAHRSNLKRARLNRFLTSLALRDDGTPDFHGRSFPLSMIHIRWVQSELDTNGDPELISHLCRRSYVEIAEDSDIPGIIDTNTEVLPLSEYLRSIDLYFHEDLCLWSSNWHDSITQLTQILSRMFLRITQKG